MSWAVCAGTSLQNIAVRTGFDLGCYAAAKDVSHSEKRYCRSCGRISDSYWSEYRSHHCKRFSTTCVHPPLVSDTHPLHPDVFYFDEDTKRKKKKKECEKNRT